MFSVYRVIRKIFTKHMLVHLFIPLLVGLIFEVSLDYQRGHFHEGQHEANGIGFALGIIGQILSDKIVLILGIIVTYLVISFIFLYKETRTQIQRSQLADLNESLEQAESFFATCTLSLQEFFEPSTQLYFSRLIKKEMDDKANGKIFKQRRVWIFFSGSDLKDAITQSIGAHYTAALTTIHEYFGIDLAYLPPKEVRRILKALTVEEKILLHYYPRWMKRFPKKLLNYYRRREVSELDFALIGQTGGRNVVIPFSKYGKSLAVSSNDTKTIEVYEKLEGLISKVIYEDASNKDRLKNRYKLINLLD